jgi:hypothetical protein
VIAGIARDRKVKTLLRTNTDARGSACESQKIAGIETKSLTTNKQW